MSADWKSELLDRISLGQRVDTPEWAEAASKAATLEDFVTMLAWIVHQECETLRKREGGDLRRLCMLLKTAVKPHYVKPADADKLAERIAEYAVAATHVYGMMSSDPAYVQRLLDREESRKQEMMPHIAELLAPLLARNAAMEEDNKTLEKWRGVLQHKLEEANQRFMREAQRNAELLTDLALLRRSDLLVIANAEKDATIAAMQAVLRECATNIHMICKSDYQSQLLSRIDQLTAKGAGQ